jgi:hypothetical protein
MHRLLLRAVYPEMSAIIKTVSHVTEQGKRTLPAALPERRWCIRISEAGRKEDWKSDELVKPTLTPSC